MPDEGFIKFDGKIISELDEKDLYNVRRKFGFLFQGAALFDSMTVSEIYRLLSMRMAGSTRNRK